MVDVAGNAAGKTLKRMAATKARTAEVKPAQKMVDRSKKLPWPFLLEREAVPDVIEKNARGNTTKVPSLSTTLENSVINARNAALSLSTSSKARPIKAAARYVNHVFMT
jgi:hypothetical protein